MKSVRNKNDVYYQKMELKNTLLNIFEKKINKCRVRKRMKSIDLIKQKTHGSIDHEIKKRFIQTKTADGLSYFKGCIDAQIEAYQRKL